MMTALCALHGLFGQLHGDEAASIAGASAAADPAGPVVLASILVTAVVVLGLALMSLARQSTQPSGKPVPVRAPIAPPRPDPRDGHGS